MDKSLVMFDRSVSDGRYRLLETLRQYGHSLAVDRGEIDELRSRHGVHFAAVAAQARAWFEGAHNTRGRELFEAEWDNVRAALEHAESAGNEASANRLVRSTFWYAYWGARDEHAQWSHRRVPALVHDDPEMLGIAAVWAAFPLGDYASGERFARRAVASAPAPEHPSAAIGWWAQMLTMSSPDRVADAVVADLGGKRAVAASDDLFTKAFILSVAAPTIATVPQDAPALIARARILVEGLGNGTLEAIFSLFAGTTSFVLGDYQQALHELERSVEAADRACNYMSGDMALVHLAIRSQLDPMRDSTQLLRTAIERFQARHQPSFMLLSITGAASWFANRGRIEAAARVVGYLEQNDPRHWLSFADVWAQTVALVDTEADAARWRSEGAGMTRDEIVSFCLDQLRQLT